MDEPLTILELSVETHLVRNLRGGAFPIDQAHDASAGGHFTAHEKVRVVIHGVENTCGVISPEIDLVIGFG